MITADLIKKVTPGAQNLILVGVENALNILGAQYGLTTPVRLNAFLAQAAHETDGFKTLKEYGNDAYFKKYETGTAKGRDLGNTQPGDGLRFKGRGIFQTTGRYNYSKVSRAMFGDDRLLTNPALLEQPFNAVLSALIYWSNKKLNPVADQDSTAGFLAITKAINGGTNGLENRKKYLAKFKALGDYLKKNLNILKSLYYRWLGNAMVR
jgi:putative chitinase